MKILDEIMACHRDGGTITYRDLLPVVDAVQKLESDLVRAVHADGTKACYIGQLREEVRALTAQRDASLDPLVRAKMLALTPTVAFPGLDHLTRAFEKWETAYRSGETLSPEEAAQMTVREAAANKAEHFLKLLAEVQL